MPLILLLVSGLIALFLLYAAVAYYFYHRVKPSDSPCRDCSNPVIVGGWSLFYRELGTDKGRPPVVLVHGGPGHSSLSFKNGFDFLGEQMRVIFYDQRGSGNSQIQPDPAGYTIEQLVEELEALRREVVKAEKIVVIGHSFGSALSQRYALKYPDHVEKLVLISGVRINNGIRSHFLWKWFGPALYSFGLGFPPADAQTADAWFTHGALPDDIKRLYDPKRVDLLSGMGTLSFAPWREISLSMTGCDYKTGLGQLSIPTLFLYGAADARYTGKAAADEICSILPNCKSVGFDGSGHWPYLEEPEKFQKVLRDFLDG